VTQTILLQDGQDQCGIDTDVFCILHSIFCIWSNGYIDEQLNPALNAQQHGKIAEFRPHNKRRHKHVLRYSQPIWPEMCIHDIVSNKSALWPALRGRRE